jgi:hypothetical protein
MSTAASVFSEAELAYLQGGRRLARIATVDRDGTPHVWMLLCDLDQRTELVMFTLWDSLDAVKAFAGEDYETGVFDPEDERFLIERDLRAVHYDVAVSVGGAAS